MLYGNLSFSLQTARKLLNQLLVQQSELEEQQNRQHRKEKAFPCLVTFQRKVITTSNALLINNNDKIQLLSEPQPQINPVV